MARLEKTVEKSGEEPSSRTGEEPRDIQTRTEERSKVWPEETTTGSNMREPVTGQRNSLGGGMANGEAPSELTLAAHDGRKRRLGLGNGGRHRNAGAEKTAAGRNRNRPESRRNRNRGIWARSFHFTFHFTLAGKTLAIDASIWMVQFIKATRDDKGEMVRNAHLLGFFQRICKLLFLRTKPVFVFDGATRALKRRTVISRRMHRENSQAKSCKTAEKLLLNGFSLWRGGFSAPSLWEMAPFVI